MLVDCHRQLQAVGEEVVSRARATRAVRPDLDQRDLLWVAHGVAQSVQGDDGVARVERLRTRFLAGMRA